MSYQISENVKNKIAALVADEKVKKALDFQRVILCCCDIKKFAEIWLYKKIIHTNSVF